MLRCPLQHAHVAKMEQIEGPKGDYSRHTVRVLREEVEQEGRVLIDSEIQSLQRAGITQEQGGCC